MENTLQKVEKYTTSLLRTQLPHEFYYHNLSHTQRVVKKTKQLIEDEDLEKEDHSNLIIAAWFHDTGYIKSCDNHEEESVIIATEFLNSISLDKTDISKISSLIMATKISHDPINLSEKIIRDADKKIFLFLRSIIIFILIMHKNIG